MLLSTKLLAAYCLWGCISFLVNAQPACSNPAATTKLCSAPQNKERVTAQDRGTYPIQATFLNFYRKLTPELWEREFQSMADLGIRTVVVVSVGHLRANPSDPSGFGLAPDGLLYPSSLVMSRERPTQDLLETILSLADRQGMTVYLGSLQTATDWTDGTEFDALRVYNRQVAEEILQRYGQHTSLRGWYFTQEIWLNWAKYYGANYYGIALVKNWVADMKWIDGSKLAAVSVVIKKSGYHEMPGLAATELQDETTTFLRSTKIDILAAQDGIGARNGAPSLDDLPSYFGVMAAARRKAGTGAALWSVIETFIADPNSSSERFPVAPISRIQNQASKVSPYVDRYISWIFGDDMSPQATYYPVQASQLNRQYRLVFQAPRNGAVDDVLPLVSYQVLLPPSPLYPDSTEHKLSDRSGGGYNGSDLSSWIGFSANDGCGTAQITADLGTAKTLHSARALTQSWMASGIYHPARIDVDVSRDGLNWTPFGSSASFPQDTQDFAVLWGEVQGSATARYVRWTFTYRGWLFLAELEAVGIA